MTNQTPQSTFDEKAIEILETLSAEAFIFGNFALKKGTGLPLPDDNHELPPVEKALKAIKALVLEALPEKKDSSIEHVMNYHEVNGFNQAIDDVRSIITKGE